MPTTATTSSFLLLCSCSDISPATTAAALSTLCVPTRRNITTTQRLADAFDLVSADSGDSDPPLDLSGLHLLICSKTALDSQGTLCLDAAADVEDWAGFLGGVDPDYAREKKQAAAALRGLEGSVAAAVGVRMLFTAAPYLMTHEYR